MAFEFKKLSDVEVVAEPSESANVLIEENGVIKKAPKTAVGGAGGGGADGEVGYDFDAEVSGDENYNLTVTAHSVLSYAEFKDKILGGSKPTSRVKFTLCTWAGSTFFTEVCEGINVYYQPEDGAAEQSEEIIFKADLATGQTIKMRLYSNESIYAWKG